MPQEIFLSAPCPFPGEIEIPEKPTDKAWPAILGIILRAAYAVGVLVYVAFYTSDFTLFQKLAVLLVAFIVYAAAKAIIHVAWPGSRRMKYRWL